MNECFLGSSRSAGDKYRELNDDLVKGAPFKNTGSKSPGLSSKNLIHPVNQNLINNIENNQAQYFNLAAKHHIIDQANPYGL
mmetsp:Transcript_369/g.314  ORF Transcript_369/g.314 Transcript_369/m.314 type:complete len:82 (-) Transcript_369:36-281(-)